MKALALRLLLLLASLFAATIIEASPVTSIARDVSESHSPSSNLVYLKRRAAPPNFQDFLRRMAQHRELEGDGQMTANIAHFIQLMEYLSAPTVSQGGQTVYAWQVLMLMNHENLQHAHLLAAVLHLHPDLVMMPFQPGMNFKQLTLPMFGGLYSVLGSSTAVTQLTSTQAPADLATVQQMASTILGIHNEGVVLPTWIRWPTFLRRWIRSAAIGGGHQVNVIRYWNRFLKQLLIQLRHGNRAGQFAGQLYSWQVVLVHFNPDADASHYELLMDFVNILNSLPADAAIFQTVFGGAVNQNLITLLNAQTQQQLAAYPALQSFLQSTAVQPVDQLQGMVENLMGPPVQSPASPAASTGGSVSSASRDDALEVVHAINNRLLGLRLDVRWKLSNEDIESLKMRIKALLAGNGGRLLVWHVIFSQIISAQSLTEEQRNQLLVALVVVAGGDSASVEAVNGQVQAASTGGPMSTALPLFSQALQQEMDGLQQFLNSGAPSTSAANAAAQQQFNDLSALQQFLGAQQMPNIGALVQNIQQSFPDLPAAVDDAGFDENDWLDDQEVFIDDEMAALEMTEIEESQCDGVGSLADWNQALQQVQQQAGQPPSAPSNEQPSGSGGLPGISGPLTPSSSSSSSFRFRRSGGGGGSASGGSLRRRATEDPSAEQPGSMNVTLLADGGNKSSGGTRLTLDSPALYDVVAECSRQCLLGQYLCDKSDNVQLLESPDQLSLTFPTLKDEKSALTLANCVWIQLQSDYSARMDQSAASSETDPAPALKSKCTLTEAESHKNPAVSGMPWSVSVQAPNGGAKGTVDLQQQKESVFFLSVSQAQLLPAMTANLDACVAEVGKGCQPELAVQHESIALTSTIQQLQGPTSATVLFECVVKKFGVVPAAQQQQWKPRLSRRAVCFGSKGIWVGLGEFGICLNTNAASPHRREGDRELLEQAPQCASVPRADTSGWMAEAQQKLAGGSSGSNDGTQSPFLTPDKRQISGQWAVDGSVKIEISSAAAASAPADGVKAVLVEEYVQLATKTCIPLVLCNEPALSADAVSTLLEGGKVSRGSTSGSTAVILKASGERITTSTLGWNMIYCMAHSIFGDLSQASPASTASLTPAQTSVVPGGIAPADLQEVVGETGSTDAPPPAKEAVAEIPAGLPPGWTEEMMQVAGEIGIPSFGG